MASILVIEDDENIAQLLAFMFRREGHDVGRLADGEAAFLHIKSDTPPDAVILDYMLPYRDGIELLRLMRSLPRWAAVPVVMLSGKTLEREVITALDAGANDYVTKPFQPDELMARVRRLLPRLKR